MIHFQVYNKGKRFVEFKDRHKIMFTFCTELYNNSFFGTIRHESIGEILFKDLSYGFECNLKFDSASGGFFGTKK